MYVPRKGTVKAEVPKLWPVRGTARWRVRLGPWGHGENPGLRSEREWEPLQETEALSGGVFLGSDEMVQLLC